MLRVLVETYIETLPVHVLPWHREEESRLRNGAKMLANDNVTVFKALVTARAYEYIETLLMAVLRPALERAENESNADKKEEKKILDSVHALSNPTTFWGNYVKRRILEAFDPKYGPAEYGLGTLYRLLLRDKKRLDMSIEEVDTSPQIQTLPVRHLTRIAIWMLKLTPDSTYDRHVQSTVHSTPIHTFSIIDFARRLELKTPTLDEDSDLTVGSFSTSLLENV